MPTINLSPHFSLSADEIKAFRNGKLELHCLVMKLIRPKPNADSFSGSGFIKQASVGSFKFVMYSKKSESAFNLFKEMFGGGGKYRPGQLIPDTDYYTLICVDDKGRKWIGKQIWPDKNTSKNGTVLTGDCFELSMKGRLPKQVHRSHLNLEFVGGFNVPSNTMKKIEQTVGSEQSVVASSRNILQFEHDSVEYSFTKENNFLELAISSEIKKFNKNYETRVTEALQFVLGQPMPWTIFTKGQGKTSHTTIRSNKQKTISTKPPISATPTNSEVFCLMFTTYLEYIVNFKGNYFHPISAQIRSVAQARSVNTETLALVLSVAVESMLQNVDAQHSISKEELEWIGKAEEYFSNWDGPETIKYRIVRFISSTLKNPKSAKTSLTELVQLKITTNRHRKAWDELRNKLAHGGGIGSTPLQEFLDLVDTVLVLFYHLVFYIIGYKGKYTDYSINGWPERNYPLDDGYV